MVNVLTGGRKKKLKARTLSPATQSEGTRPWRAAATSTGTTKTSETLGTVMLASIALPSAVATAVVSVPSR